MTRWFASFAPVGRGADRESTMTCSTSKNCQDKSGQMGSHGEAHRVFSGLARKLALGNERASGDTERFRAEILVGLRIITSISSIYHLIITLAPQRRRRLQSGTHTQTFVCGSNAHAVHAALHTACSVIQYRTKEVTLLFLPWSVALVCVPRQ